MFVPYTVGSELARRLRDAEAKIQDMTGYRLKIVERAGTKLEDALRRADPGKVTMLEKRDHFHPEYNRSSVPRPMCKLGDKSYKKYEPEIDTDMAKEEIQIR